MDEWIKGAVYNTGEFIKNSAKSIGGEVVDVFKKTNALLELTSENLIGFAKTTGVMFKGMWNEGVINIGKFKDMLQGMWQKGSAILLDGARTLKTDLTNFAVGSWAWYNMKREEGKRKQKQAWEIIKRGARKLHVAEVPEEAKEYADFAELARNDKMEIPKDNIELITDEELEKYGLNAEMLKSNGTGFGARVFLSEVTGELIVSFAGTDPTSVKDWWTDIRQSLGFETGQYEKARRIAEALADPNNGIDLNKITFVGHSLGGGMASLAGAITGSKTITFNSAGLHQNTLKRAHAEKNSTANITAYIHQGDLLKYVQEDKIVTRGVLPDPLGSKVYYGSGVHNYISQRIIPGGEAIRIIDGMINHPEFKE
jgi:hypothetical protein